MTRDLIVVALCAACNDNERVQVGDAASRYYWPLAFSHFAYSFCHSP